MNLPDIASVPVTISLLDPSVTSLNHGDQIIIQAVKRELQELFPQAFIRNFSTHLPLGRFARRLIAASPLTIVGGSNLLASDMYGYRQWQITLLDSLVVKQAVLMGVGWWQYQTKPTNYTRLLLKRLLHPTLLHAVRDSYTRQQLLEAGIGNTLLTGCPSLWRLTADHCRQIPRVKGEEVLFTLTDYLPDPVADLALCSTLCASYDKVFFWPQGSEDLNYLATLGLSSHNLELLPSSLAAFDELLESNRSLDYVGTRLHAGIRALQYGRRSLIVAIDNRATEMGKDFGLPVVLRRDISNVEQLLTSEFVTELQLPWKAIDEWKGQFTAL